MFSRLFLSFAFSISALPAFALCDGPSFLDQITPDERAQIDSAVANTPFPEGLMWRAVRGTDEITLIGTIHINTDGLQSLREKAAPYVRRAGLVLVEATEAEETALLAALANEPALYLITEGPTLPELLSPDMWEKVSAAATARDIPPFMVAQFQPWYLGLTLAIPPCAMSGMMSGEMGLDHMIMDDALNAGVPLAPLEPWETLIDVLRGGSIAEQVDQLDVALPPVDLQERIFAAMLDGYSVGRTAEMWEASRIAVNYIPDIDPVTARQLFAETEQALLIDRNLAWMPVIAAASAENAKLVVAAGAAHLPGEFGVLNLLQQDGWTITRLD